MHDGTTRGPASADRPRLGPFAALVGAACTDAGAARGLAEAYAALPALARRQLVAAIVTDGQAEAATPAVVLATLLGVEDNPLVAKAILEAIATLAGKGLVPAAPERAMLGGDEHRGAALLARPLFANFVEVATVSWEPEGGVTRAAFESIAHHRDLGPLLATLPDDSNMQEVPWDSAVQVVVAALWRYRRRASAVASAAGLLTMI